MRIDGSTGQTLFETSRPLNEPTGSYDYLFYAVYAGGLRDASGDGQGDAYMGAWSLALVENPGTGELDILGAWSDYSFESGADGSVLASAEGPGWFEVWPEPDLDGDGAADMSEWHYPIDHGQGLQVILQSLAPATVLWDREIPAAEAWETTFLPSGDQDGAPGAEVIYGRNIEDDGHWSSMVASLSGATGIERWRLEL